MPAFARYDGAAKETAAFAKDGGVWKPAIISVNVSGNWQRATREDTPLDPLSALANGDSPLQIVGQGRQTSLVSVTVTGGSGSFTYAWTAAASAGNVNAQAISPASPRSRQTIFNLSQGTQPNSVALWRCTVTDTVTGQITTVDVGVGFGAQG